MIAHTGKDVEQEELSFIAGGSKICTTTLGKKLAVSQKIADNSTSMSLYPGLQGSSMGDPRREGEKMEETENVKNETKTGFLIKVQQAVLAHGIYTGRGRNEASWIFHKA